MSSQNSPNEQPRLLDHVPELSEVEPEILYERHLLVLVFDVVQLGDDWSQPGVRPQKPAVVEKRQEGSHFSSIVILTGPTSSLPS